MRTTMNVHLDSRPVLSVFSHGSHTWFEVQDGTADSRGVSFHFHDETLPNLRAACEAFNAALNAVPRLEAAE